MPCCSMMRCSCCIPASSSPARASPSRMLASISKRVLDKPARVAECQSNTSKGTYWRRHDSRRALVHSGKRPHRRCRCQYRTDVSMVSYKLLVSKKPATTQARSTTASLPHATRRARCGVSITYTLTLSGSLVDKPGIVAGRLHQEPYDALLLFLRMICTHGVQR